MRGGRLSECVQDSSTPTSTICAMRKSKEYHKRSLAGRSAAAELPALAAPSTRSSAAGSCALLAGHFWRAAMADTEQPGSRRPKLAWYHLIGVTFFAVCGGDYGIEDAVGAAGAAYTLAGLVLLPWIWSMPIAMMTAELSSMIPEAGGYVVWIHRAFGPFWAHQNAMWNLVSNTFDNALYPVMFADYLRYFPLLRLGGVARYVVSLTMLGCVTGLNLLGVDVIASASSLFAIFVISPFAVLAVAGLPSLDTDVWFEPVGHSVRWGTFLSVLLWNTSGYDSVGALAAEVRHPGFDFPVAMVVTISLITLVYVIPLSGARARKAAPPSPRPCPAPRRLGLGQPRPARRTSLRAADGVSTALPPSPLAPQWPSRWTSPTCRSGPTATSPVSPPSTWASGSPRGSPSAVRSRLSACSTRCSAPAPASPPPRRASACVGGHIGPLGGWLGGRAPPSARQVRGLLTAGAGPHRSSRVSSRVSRSRRACRAARRLPSRCSSPLRVRCPLRS